VIHNLNVARVVDVDRLYETQDGEFVFAMRLDKRGKALCVHVGSGHRAGKFWPSELLVPTAEVPT
jgi:hypothetical protein